MIQALQDILEERRRQQEAEGWSHEHDDAHNKGELARAGGLYALVAGSGSTEYRNALDGSHMLDPLEAAMRYWPWDRSWFKPSSRRRDLVKAGALIMEEIERLDRAAESVDE